MPVGIVSQLHPWMRGHLLLRHEPYMAKTDEHGRYAYTTIVPGHYLNGVQYRPAHIHLKASAAAHAPLTTQLYFAGDPRTLGLIRAVEECRGL